MYKRKMLFVYNPKAGKAHIRNHLLDIINIFTRGGYEVTTVPTQAAGDAIQIVRNREDIYDIVVCSGGDGSGYGNAARGKTASYRLCTCGKYQ